MEVAARKFPRETMNYSILRRIYPGEKFTVLKEGPKKVEAIKKVLDRLLVPDVSLLIAKRLESFPFKITCQELKFDPVECMEKTPFANSIVFGFFLKVENLPFIQNIFKKGPKIFKVEGETFYYHKFKNIFLSYHVQFLLDIFAKYNFEFYVITKKISKKCPSRIFPYFGKFFARGKFLEGAVCREVKNSVSSEIQS